MSNTQQHIQHLWSQRDLNAMEALLARQRCVDGSEDTLVWSALCARARGDTHAAYRFLAPLLRRSLDKDNIMALLGTLGDELTLPQLSLQGWQAAVNANPLELNHRKKLGKYHVSQGNPAMAMAVLEPYRLYHHQDAEGVQALLPAPEPAEFGSIEKGSDLAPGAIVVIIPIYEDLEATQACVERVIRFLPLASQPVHVLLINDCSPNEALGEWLRGLAASHPGAPLELIEHATNQGFIRSVNAGLERYPLHDALLLNADALVHGSWIDRLHEAAYCETGIGSVTPMSNFGELVSFPTAMNNNPLRSDEQVDELDSITAEVNDYAPETIPIGVGFCLYLRRDALQEVGLLNAADYKRGYGEEADLCLRLASAGYRNVCATNVYVGHQGSRSFGGEKPLRVAQNAEVLRAHYPHYENQFDRFVFQDHLGPARQRLELAWLLQADVSWHLVLANHMGVDDPRVQPIRFAAAQRGEPLLIFYRDRRKGGRSFRFVAECVPAIQSLCFYMPYEKQELRKLVKALEYANVTCLEPAPKELEGLLSPAGSAANELAEFGPTRSQLASVVPHNRIVAVEAGDDPAGEYGVIRQVALFIAQRELPIRLWLQYETLNDAALVALGCIDVGQGLDVVDEDVHLAAGGSRITWRPSPAAAITDEIEALVHGW